MRVYSPASCLEKQTLAVLRAMDDDGLPPRRLQQFTVVHKPRVAVRATRSTTADIVTTKTTGAIVSAKKEENGWIELDGEPGFMLIDGTGVAAGLGILLERVPVPDTPLTLFFSHPTTGKPLLELQTTMLTTIKQVKQAVGEQTELKASAIVMARGRQGQRISDSAANLFGDGETVWACGYEDRQEVGYMYMGAL